MNRTKFSTILLLLLLTAFSAYSQIGMNLTAEHERFLKFERIQMHLILRNYSGNTLTFGSADANGGRLIFTVTSQSGNKLIEMLDPKANPMEGMLFAPGESRELTITLNALFDLQKDGFYTVTAYIDHKRLPQGFASNTVNFEVRDGMLITSKTIGLPTAKSDELIKNVTASLMRFNDGKSEIYCLRIDDDNCVYGTFRIGPYIAGSQPQLDADGTSAIHVLVQVRPRLYAYAVYSIVSGEAKLRQLKYYLPDNGVPTLSRAPGYLKILYARPAVEGVDYQLEK